MTASLPGMTRFGLLWRVFLAGLASVVAAAVPAGGAAVVIPRFAPNLVFLAAFAATWGWAIRRFLSAYRRAHPAESARSTTRLAALAVAGSLALYVAVLGGAGKLISAYGFGMVNYHARRLGWPGPMGYAGPAIPPGARDVHIEQTGWLDPYLVVKFTADRPAVDSFLAELKLEWQDGVRLPEETSYMSRYFEDAQNFFYEVRHVENGQSFVQTSRSASGTLHGRFVAVDRTRNVVYYMAW